MKDIEDVLNYLEDNFYDETFNEYLDDLYPNYEICGTYYTASEVLHNCDPTTYRCALLDFIDGEREMWESDIIDMSDCDIISINGCNIECIEELYTCPVCGAEYDTEEDANECCYEDEEE